MKTLHPTLDELTRLVRDMNAAMDRHEVSGPDAALIKEAFADFDRVLGVMSLRRAASAASVRTKEKTDHRIPFPDGKRTVRRPDRVGLRELQETRSGIKSPLRVHCA